MKRIILSLCVIAAAAAVVVGATTAYFSDTETSTGNVFTAGGIDLKIDSTCHYDGMICAIDETGAYTWQTEVGGISTYPQLIGEPCYCSWLEDDLGEGVESKKFFDFADIKPGDEGENTVSIHVYGNDAWGAFVIDNIVDQDNEIVEPEDRVDGIMDGADGTEDGDLDSTLSVMVWLDDGWLPGFQCPTDRPACNEDPTEGDNVFEDYEMPLYRGMVSDIVGSEVLPLSEVIAAAYAYRGPNEGRGLTEDGHLEDCVTYYFGVYWSLDGETTGNIAQTDSWGADLGFEVTQYRHQADPYTTTPTVY